MRLKVLTANIAFALPSMDRLITNVRSHLAVHRRQMITLFVQPSRFDGSRTKPSRGRMRYVRRRTDLTNILSLIEKEDPDIVTLNEVLVQFHKEELQWSLSLLGYRSIVLGLSGHHPDATVATLIAAKDKGEPASSFFEPKRGFGSGGGTAALRLQSSNITVLGVHLPLPDKLPKLYAEQTKEIIRFVQGEKASGREVIAAGDWNAPSTYVRTIGAWETLGFKNADGDVPTCPTFLKKLKPLDHIFVPQAWNVEEKRAIAFGSDHLAVSAFLETEPS